MWVCGWIFRRSLSSQYWRVRSLIVLMLWGFFVHFCSYFGLCYRSVARLIWLLVLCRCISNPCVNGVCFLFTLPSFFASCFLVLCFACFSLAFHCVSIFVLWDTHRLHATTASIHIIVLVWQAFQARIVKSIWTNVLHNHAEMGFVSFCFVFVLWDLIEIWVLLSFFRWPEQWISLSNPFFLNLLCGQV